MGLNPHRYSNPPPRHECGVYYPLYYDEVLLRGTVYPAHTDRKPPQENHRNWLRCATCRAHDYRQSARSLRLITQELAPLGVCQPALVGQLIRPFISCNPYVTIHMAPSWCAGIGSDGGGGALWHCLNALDGLEDSYYRIPEWPRGILNGPEICALA